MTRDDSCGRKVSILSHRLHLIHRQEVSDKKEEEKIGHEAQKVITIRISDGFCPILTPKCIHHPQQF